MYTAGGVWGEQRVCTALGVRVPLGRGCVAGTCVCVCICVCAQLGGVHSWRGVRVRATLGWRAAWLRECMYVSVCVQGWGGVHVCTAGGAPRGVCALLGTGECVCVAGGAGGGRQGGEWLEGGVCVRSRLYGGVCGWWSVWMVGGWMLGGGCVCAWLCVCVAVGGSLSVGPGRP